MLAFTKSKYNSACYIKNKHWLQVFLAIKFCHHVTTQKLFNYAAILTLISFLKMQQEKEHLKPKKTS